MAAPNSYTTNQPQDSFLLQTQGYVQGLPYDDPVSRLWLAAGTLDAGEAIPMWGGVPINEIINGTGSGADGLGPDIKRSTSQATVTGWSTFAQMMHMLVTPSANVPVAGVTNGVGFFRNGTNQRLAVACDPALITTITGAGDNIASQALYWDVTNYRITLTTTGGNWALPTSVRLLSVNSNSKIVSWTSPNATWAAGSAAIILI